MHPRSLCRHLALHYLRHLGLRNELYSFDITVESISEVKLTAARSVEEVEAKRYFVEANEKEWLMVDRYFKLMKMANVQQ